MYSNTKIDKVFGPYGSGLIDLYYTYVHPSYPIMEPKEELLRRCRAGEVRVSLLSCIYILAMDFWSESAELKSHSAPRCAEVWNDIFVALTVETRTPNIDTVKGLLLYMQLPSHFVKEPNRPGLWALSCLLTGVVQDIGLHVDPSEWQIPVEERKARRILWWAVFAHDKWTAHFLGRRPHLSPTHCSVKPLSVDDFSDGTSRIHLDDLAAARAFIAFSNISSILGDVLEEFCTTPNKQHDPASWSQRAGEILTKLSAWRDKIDVLGEDLAESPSGKCAPTLSVTEFHLLT